MGIVRVLKRKDGASLVVGVALGMAIASFLFNVTSYLAGKVTDVSGNSNAGSLSGTSDWRTNYLLPIVSLILEILVLEILVWVYVWVYGSVRGKK